MNRHLHIISSFYPYPPDHGRSIDAYEKIIALHEQGIKIHLHYLKCGGQSETGEINKYCESIVAYENRTAMNEGLNNKLAGDNYPLLFEGDHCTKFLNPANTTSRKVLVRIHHVEVAGHKATVTGKSGLFQKLFFLNPGKKEGDGPSFQKDWLYVCSSESDAEILAKQYHLPKTRFLPAFVAWHEVRCREGMGNFCLYHGNLSVTANEKTAAWLLEKVFSEVRYPFIIAGKDPSRRIHKLVQLYSHACIVANPSQSQIHDLVQKAHINIVPALQTDCGRYKLLHSLFSGRHCITNDRMVRNTGLEEACHIANDSRSKIEAIENLMDLPFTAKEIEFRKYLLSCYNNSENICRLIDWLY